MIHRRELREITLPPKPERKILVIGVVNEVGTFIHLEEYRKYDDDLAVVLAQRVEMINRKLNERAMK